MHGVKELVELDQPAAADRTHPGRLTGATRRRLDQGWRRR